MTALHILANNYINSYYGLKAASFYDEHKTDEFKDKDLNFYIQRLEEGDSYTVAFFWTKMNTDEMNSMESFWDEDEENERIQAMLERNKDIIEDGYDGFLYDVFHN